MSEGGREGMCQGPEVRASSVGQETEMLWSENMVCVGVVGAVRDGIERSAW